MDEIETPADERLLYAIVCLSLSSKYFETNHMTIVDMHTYTNQSYTRQQFYGAQETILILFDFNLFPLSVTSVELLDIMIYMCRSIMPLDRYDTIRKTAIIIMDICTCITVDTALEVYVASLIHVSLILLSQCTAQYPVVWRLCSVFRIQEYSIASASKYIVHHIIDKSILKTINIL